MKINNIKDYKIKPNFKALKIENNILKYEKPINLLKQSKDMQNLVQAFEHKGIDVSVKLGEETYEKTILYKRMGLFGPLSFSSKRVSADISFINKLGQYIDKTAKPLKIHNDTARLSFDYQSIIDNFESKNIYH